jgi:MFS family permease
MAQEATPLKVVGSLSRGRYFPWPKRVDIAVLCFTALVIAYCDRANMSVAAPSMLKEYGWDTSQMGWVFTGFFIGYTGFMIPAGRLTDRFGPKRIFIVSMGLWSVLTALTPIPKTLSVLLFVRILLGMGEGGTLPAINAMLARWFPPREYSRAAAFCWSGGYAGSIVAFPLASGILAIWGWQAIFYCFALLGLLWLPVWLLGAADRPEDAKHISEDELTYLARERPILRPVDDVPWNRLLRLPPLWAAWGLHFSSNWFTYVMVTWLPTYLTVERKFSLMNMAVGASLPFVSALVGSNLFGSLIDRLTRGRNRTMVRKLFMLPYLLSALTLLAVPLAADPTATVGLLCIAMFLLTAATPVYASSSLDIAPRYAGTVVGMQNALANIAGVLAPVVIGYVVKSLGWSSAFWLTALVSVGGIVAYLVFGRAEKLID